MNRAILMVAYAVASLGTMLWIGLGAGRVPPTGLAAGAGVLLVALGWLLFRALGAAVPPGDEGSRAGVGEAPAEPARALPGGLDVDALRKELAQSREEYRRLFDIVPCYITIQDSGFNIIDSNTLFKQDFGHCSGMRCYQAYKGRLDLCPDCPVEKTFADGEVHNGEEIVVTRDGRKADMIVYSMPVRDDSGAIAAVMEVSTNITAVKDLQRELVLVGLAVTGMAHRIKNVMMGLEGGIFVVNTGFEEHDEATTRRGWEMVQRNTRKVSRIARDLLFCSKERPASPVEGTSPKEIARDVYETFLPIAEKEQIQLALQVDDEDGRGAFDPEALHSLMTNLVGNALDACRFDPDADKKRHAVTLRCMRDSDGSAVIEVADNGVGMTREDSDRVFEGFFSTKGTEGTGLGLLVVQKVAREHDGSVTFESAPGEGTVFRAVLRPKSPGDTDQGEPPAAARGGAA